MSRRFAFFALAALLAAAGAGLFGGAPVSAEPSETAPASGGALRGTGVAAQTPSPTPAAQPAKTPAPAKTPKPAVEKGDKLPTAEQVAETVILTYGGRERMAQIRRSGVERGRLMRTNEEGVPEEVTYARSFLRGESAEKDKVRLDQRKPTLE